MSPLPSFESDDRPAMAARLAPKLQALAAEGIYLGTSSWKYDGWLGSIYSADRYQTRGKFSRGTCGRVALGIAPQGSHRSGSVGARGG